MSWLAPLMCRYIPRRGVRQKDKVLMPVPRYRAVEINGVLYSSMLEARLTLGWSYRQIYLAIGEGRRVGRKSHERNEP